MDLRAHLRQFVARHPGPYVLAVSGGLDSMVLLDLLSDEAPVVAHYDHAVRDDSRLDATLVAGAARARGLVFESARRGKGPTDEAALRADRRAFLEAVAEKHGARIVTAHHASDQLETFLMRALRGAGLDGLGAMREVTGRWLRPLLVVPRAELAKYAERHAIAFREDPTNACEDYLRNRVRARVLPALHELADTRFTSRFAATLAELQGVADELAAATEAVFREIVVVTPYWLRVPQVDFQALRESERARLLRRIAQSLGAQTPDRETVTKLLAVIADNRLGVEAPGFTLRRSCEQLFFRRTGAAPSFRFEQQGDQWHCDALGWRLQGITEAFPGAEVRFFRAGDRSGSRKLKERLLELRIPEPERALLPVIATGGEVHEFFPRLATRHVASAPDIAWSFTTHF